MKKNLTLVAASAVLLLTSCGGSSVKLTTDLDSLSYAYGIQAAIQFRSQAPEINTDIFSKGFTDGFNKQGLMTPEQAYSYIGGYLMHGRSRHNAEASAKFLQEASEKSGVQKTSEGLLYKIEKEGNEKRAGLNDLIYVKYELTLPDGKVIDASGDNAVAMKLGGLIKAWQIALPLIGEGGKMTLYCPSDLAYGDHGAPGIGPKQALKFELELEKIEPEPAPQTLEGAAATGM